MISLKKNIRKIKFYAPYLGAAISVYNRNLVGTHFGGSLYSMCDPFYMFILMENLGKGYIVWDKAATIRFKKPGLTTVTSTFEITKERIAEIKAEVDSIGKNDYTFFTTILNEKGEVIADVEKVVYVRKKS